MALKTSRNQKRPRPKNFGSAIIIFLILSAFTLFSFESNQTLAEEPPLKVWFFDVGQGDATLIETPEGHQILIDGGRDADILSKLGSVLWPWDHQLDAIILTHPDADHVGGLPSVLDRYDVAAVYETGVSKNTLIMKRFNKAVEDEQAKHILVERGQEINFGSLTLRVIHPPRHPEKIDDTNNTSVVLLIDHGQTELLLTGDIESEVEQEIKKLVGDLDILKAAHHGSASSSTISFIKATSPENVVISVGEKNSYGHPHQAVLNRYADHQVKVWRTDRGGDILMTSDGGEPEISFQPLPF